MHITIKQEALSSLLSRAQSVLERKSTRPILETVLLTAQDGTLRLSATDLRVSITQETICTIHRPGSVAVTGRKLHEIVRELPSHPVAFEVKENGWITISAGKSLFHLPGTAADEFPTLPAAPESFIELEPQVFRQMLEKTLFAASSDESRLYLCGVFVKSSSDEQGNPYLSMVATDGHRLSMVDRPFLKELPMFREGVIVPRKGLAELRSLLDDQGTPFRLACASGRIFVNVAETMLTILLIEEAFPNYKQVIPNAAPHLTRINRALFLEALRRVSLLSDVETHSVLMQIDGDTAILTSANPQFGDAREELDIFHEGDPFRLAFNAAYCLEALRSFDGDEIFISVNDPLSPCVIRSETEPGHLCVIMPMRID